MQGDVAKGERGGVPLCHRLLQSRQVITKPQRLQETLAGGTQTTVSCGYWRGKRQTREVRPASRGRGLQLGLGRFVFFNGKKT